MIQKATTTDDFYEYDCVIIDGRLGPIWRTRQDGVGRPTIIRWAELEEEVKYALLMQINLNNG